MKPVKFTFRDNQYRCSEPGEQSGLYYRKEDFDFMAWVLKQIIKDLPTNREWLDPQLESVAKTIIEEWEINK